MDILSLLLVRPKIFINIPSDVFHCHAPGIKSPWMPHHPLQWSAVMSSHAAFMAFNRDIWSCGLWIWSYTFHLHSQKKPSTGFRHWEYGGRNSTVILSCTANQSLIMLVRWKRLRSTVNLTKCTAIVYLDILVPLLLHSFAIPLKCHLVELFHSHLMSFKNSVYGGNADIIYICEDIVIYDCTLDLS